MDSKALDALEQAIETAIVRDARPGEKPGETLQRLPEAIRARLCALTSEEMSALRPDSIPDWLYNVLREAAR